MRRLIRFSLASWNVIGGPISAGETKGGCYEAYSSF